MFLRTRPTATEISRYLDRARSTSLSYAPIGIAQDVPAAFTLDQARGLLGSGMDCYFAARRRLDQWRMFDLGWVELHPRGAASEVGTTVAVLASHLGFWSLNGCRVVYHLPAADHHHGFAYGTLDDHAERGEELFSVHIDNAERVWYEVRAVSRPRSALARLGYPVTRLLQRRFRRDSLRAMASGVDVQAG